MTILFSPSGGCTAAARRDLGLCSVAVSYF